MDGHGKLGVMSARIDSNEPRGMMRV